MFYTASFFSILSILILYSLKETLSERQAFALGMLRIKRSEIFEPLVFAPTLIMFLGVFSFGAILTVIPDFSKSLGVENKGIFFTFYTISSLAIRFIAGKLSDRYGRVLILKWSSLMLIFALLYIGFAQADWQLMLGACFFGMAVGMNSPTLVAWTIDLSDEQYKGRAMATMYIGMEAGIGLGALLGGYIYNNQIERLPQVFMLSAALVLAAYLYLLWYKPKIAANT
jgi:MFS family permease